MWKVLCRFCEQLKRVLVSSVGSTACFIARFRRTPDYPSKCLKSEVWCPVYDAIQLPSHASTLSVCGEGVYALNGCQTSQRWSCWSAHSVSTQNVWLCRWNFCRGVLVHSRHTHTHFSATCIWLTSCLPPWWTFWACCNMQSFWWAVLISCCQMVPTRSLIATRRKRKRQRQQPCSPSSFSIVSG